MDDNLPWGSADGKSLMDSNHGPFQSFPSLSGVGRRPERMESEQNEYKEDKERSTFHDTLLNKTAAGGIVQAKSFAVVAAHG
jgi:hypothetical protein